ncbi:MAG: TetR/AcrR family transcriptional regulator C-terminal domain-containing protein [Bacillota bacterium]|nr:TetR/AcrR family transcriptional regulator C-terminal domain-containing protein [Bacillota bacterium]
MKNKTRSRQTKEKLAASLKKSIRKKPINRVTVNELVEDCNVNRKTFYYHFDDIYALLKWMLDQEAVEIVKDFNLVKDYRSAILFVMDYVEENEFIINSTYSSIGRDHLKRLFYQDFLAIFRTVVDDAEQTLGLQADPDYKDFLCKFYVEALAGLLIDWVQNGTGQDKQKTLDYISRIFEESLPNVLRAGTGSSVRSS